MKAFDRSTSSGRQRKGVEQKRKIRSSQCEITDVHRRAHSTRHSSTPIPDAKLYEEIDRVTGNPAIKPPHTARFLVHRCFYSRDT